MRTIISLFVFCCLVSGIYAADYYVDVDSIGGPGDDQGPGAKNQPWKTLGRLTNGADTALSPLPGAGDTVWIRGGVYKERLVLFKGGTKDKPLIIKAYPGEKAVIASGDKMDGIIIPEWGKADHVIIESLTIKGDVSIDRKEGIILKSLEISGATNSFGIYLRGCKGCKIMACDVSNCGGGIMVDCQNPNDGPIGFNSEDIVIADNHIHNNRKGGIRIFSVVGISMRGEGVLASVEPAGPGLARLTTQDLDLRKVRHGTLFGQDDRGSVAAPCLALFFPATNEPTQAGGWIKGGPFLGTDNRSWFALRNNPEWGGKPFSPDGKQGLFEIGSGNIEELSQAKYCYIGYVFDPRSSELKDIQIINNEVEYCDGQGIKTQCADYLLIRNNKTHHNGVTGIQIETACRNIWIEGNISYANNRFYGSETGIWLDENMDVVVQNNIIYENQKGMGITQCERVLARRNIIYNNKGQHVLEGKEQTAKIIKQRAGSKKSTHAIWFSGGRLYHLGAPPGARDNAFIHNTMFNNGNDDSSCGGILHGLKGFPEIGQNLILNNLVQDNHGQMILKVFNSNPVFDGNIYYGKTNLLQVCWDVAGQKKTYTLSNPEALAEYQKATGQDRHSQVAETAFAGADKADFRLTKESPAIDKGVPLALTVSKGEGSKVMVNDVRCFSAGFKNSKGELLVPGDEIMIGKSPAKILAIDREKKELTLDKEIKWNEGEAVGYLYTGAGPDVGAIEREGKWFRSIRFW